MPSTPTVRTITASHAEDCIALTCTTVAWRMESFSVEASTQTTSVIWAFIMRQRERGQDTTGLEYVRARIGHAIGTNPEATIDREGFLHSYSRLHPEHPDGAHAAWEALTHFLQSQPHSDVR